MKKIFLLACSALLMVSCSMFEIDNYDEPKETIRGRVIDAATGEPVLTDQGSEGIRVSLKELSWGENVKENPDFYCLPDGTFQNTKIFKGNYNIRIDGPFVPLYYENSDGVVTVNETKTMDIKGTVDVTFEVQPFLRVRFAEEPSVSAGVITAKIIVERAITEEAFAAAMADMGGYDAATFNVTDIQLFVSTAPRVGYRNRDERWTNEIVYSGSSFNALLGQPVTISSKGTIPGGTTIFVRAAARINYETYRYKRYNYSEILDVAMPAVQ